MPTPGGYGVLTAGSRPSIGCAASDSGGYLWGDVIFQAFPKIPQNERTLENFVVDPSWRRELNKKIFAHARGSGIQIAYNLFYTQVPEFFADYYPELGYHELNMKNVGIDHDQPQCKEIMKRYWKAILDIYGVDESLRSRDLSPTVDVDRRCHVARPRR